MQERQKRNFLEATSQLETTTPFTSGPGIYNLLPNAIMMEVECMEKLKDLLLNIPEEMCYLSKHESIAHTTNDVCWTGSSLGRSVQFVRESQCRPIGSSFDWSFSESLNNVGVYECKSC